EEYEGLFREANDLSASGDLAGAVSVLSRVPAPKAGEEGEAFVRSRMQIARIGAAAGAPGKALEAAREVLALYPDNSEAKNFLDALEKQQMPRWKRFVHDAGRYLPPLLKGAVTTVALVLFTMAVSPLGGLAVALGRVSRVPLLPWVCRVYIWLFRGTPLLLQLFFIYYGLPSLGITLKPLTAAVLGLALNYSAYLGEIIRGAIESVDRGQMEAAKAIGMTYGQAMRRVIIPQTYKRLMPPVGNEFIALIKDTALVSTIAMVELMRSADQLFNAYFDVTTLVLAALVYLLLTTIFTFAFEKLEHRAGIYEHR
ncbi:MAG TPA: amino acid ABC transporter permease, partial [Verrucomicrobiae bacterium]|nr:amino acid ABC transporter permease [Verrucomicrobiae bacterium]